jgi:hypothetical protein
VRIAFPSRLVEALEHVRQLLLRDALAVILDLEPGPQLVAADPAAHLAARGREAHRVVDQVVQDLAQRLFVGEHPDGAARLAANPHSARLLGRPHLGEVPRHERGQIDRMQGMAAAVGDQPAALEHVVHQSAHAVGLLHDVAQRNISHSGRELARLEGLGVELDRRERRLHLVGDVGDELFLLLGVAPGGERLGQLVGQADDEEEQQDAAGREQDPVERRARGRADPAAERRDSRPGTHHVDDPHHQKRHGRAERQDVHRHQLGSARGHGGTLHRPMLAQWVRTLP